VQQKIDTQQHAKVNNNACTLQRLAMAFLWQRCRHLTLMFRYHWGALLIGLGPFESLFNLHLEHNDMSTWNCSGLIFRWTNGVQETITNRTLLTIIIDSKALDPSEQKEVQSGAQSSTRQIYVSTVVLACANDHTSPLCFLLYVTFPPSP
jgi:hypothetical protein